MTRPPPSKAVASAAAWTSSTGWWCIRRKARRGCAGWAFPPAGSPPCRTGYWWTRCLARPIRWTAPLTFLLFGKIKPYKGADVLIKAFAAVPEHLRARAKVKIVGKPYMDLAPLHALAERCGFLVDIDPGYLTDEAVTELFSRPGTVAVFPYREIEASGVMFLAMAHGRPMIASRLGSFAEFVIDGEHGHLVPPDDVAALADAMVHLLTDRAFAAHCSAAVRNLVLDVPGWGEIAQRTETTYRAAMATRPMPAPQFMTAGARG